jgi:hypothetical protein
MSGTRRPVLLPPHKTLVLARDGTMSLGWLEWLGQLGRVVMALVERTQVASAPFDWPPIAPGATATASFSVPGAVPGFVTVVLDPTNGSLVATGQVTAADTVVVAVTNTGAGAVDLAPGTTWIRLERVA